MDREVIEQKLESLRRCLQRVAEKCPSDPATLGRDLDLQDIVTLNLTRAVQLSVDLGAHLIADLDVLPPDSMGNPSMRWPTPESSPNLWHNNSKRQRAFGISLCITMRKSTGRLSTVSR
jgi:hypothetical protein